MKSNSNRLFLLLLVLLPCIVLKAQIITFNIPGATNTYVTCVNDSNLMGGYYDNASGIHGFVYNGANVFPVDYPGAVQTYVYGLNSAKKVVGAYNLNGNTTSNEGFMYDMNTGIYTDITTSWLSQVDLTIARDINDANCVVGDYKQSTTHVCFSMCGGANASFHYNYKPTYINSVNNTGRRAGFWIDVSFRHGLIYTNGSWTQVDFPGATRTMMTGINDSNISVGIFNLNRSFIYNNGIFREIKKTGATDIQVRDINNKGMVVGYYKDATNTYHGFHLNVWDILFRPYPNGWKFPNSDATVWPPSWYGQFIYTHDPYLGGDSWFPKYTYPDGTVDTVARLFFPDWPLFVEVMGENQCYSGVGSFRVLKAKATLKYFTILGEWGGSCFGFVQSSYMAWDSLQRFKAKFPEVGPWMPNFKIYNLPVSDENRKCINHLMVKQSQSHYYSYKAAHKNDLPTLTLQRVKEMLVDRSKNERGLIIRNQHPNGGGHIVNPYKVLVDTLNDDLEYIYVYDNNCPSDSTRKITIKKSTDSWYYDLAVNATAPSE